MHGRPITEGALQLPLPGTDAESAIDDMSGMENSEGPEGTESTAVTLGKSNETISQSHGCASADPNQHLSNLGTAKSIPVLQAELNSLQAQKSDAVRRFDRSISALEGALEILQRGS